MLLMTAGREQILKDRVFNEWVVRDTSRKVKTVFKTKFAEGACYGAY